jgi:N-acetylgalactosamine-N,N'-diacetylbacillosaminyl-diphospho-undecaprenol 4-alpha-N-acetylgalactosaminyltransferase
MDSTIKYNLPQDQEIVYLKQNDLKQYPIEKFFSLIYWAYQYKKLCSQHNIDISLSFMNRANYINIISRFFGSKSKIVISERIVSSNEYSTQSIKDILSRSLVKKLYPKADLILPNSQGIQRDLIQNFHIDETLIEVINNPIDIDKINEMCNEPIEKPLDESRFNFITVGRLHPQKNHKILLEAIKELDANLYIIGEGYLKNQLLEQIQALSLQNRVFLLGNQTNPFKYLKQADCFLFSSNYEGFPNVVLEALTVGLPVISTDCNSGPREILDPQMSIDIHVNGVNLGEYGILVKVNSIEQMKQAMRTIISSDDLRNTYKNKALKRAEDYQISVIMQKYLDKLGLSKRVN